MHMLYRSVRFIHGEFRKAHQPGLQGQVDVMCAFHLRSLIAKVWMWHGQQHDREASTATVSQIPLFSAGTGREGPGGWQEWELFYYEKLPNYAVRELCVAHSRAYTALIRISLLILRREIARQLSQLLRNSHIEFVCQLQAYPLESKTK